MQSLSILTSRRALFTLITISVLLTALISTAANAESWELRTAAHEVKGTRDIESGRLDKGIRILEANYGTTPYRHKVAVLTNLCLAYTIKRDYDTAMNYCNRAVARRFGVLEAHNNRGVLQALLGNYAAAIADFEKAGCQGECSNRLAVTGNQRMDVAKRNLNRAQSHHVAQQLKQKQEILVVKLERP